MIQFLKNLFSRKSKQRVETFIWVGDGVRPLNPGELVGRPYVDENGITGVVVENTQLTLTVKF